MNIITSTAIIFFIIIIIAFTFKTALHFFLLVIQFDKFRVFDYYCIISYGLIFVNQFLLLVLFPCV